MAFVVRAIKKTRGRPRRFNVEDALATAQAMFHARGYDAVAVADLTEAIGINPPSFYAAFGSKASLFGRILGRYRDAGLKLADVVDDGCTPSNALRFYLGAAARLYAADPMAPGCLILESARGLLDPTCTALARDCKRAVRDTIRAFLADRQVAGTETAADFVVVAMTGLSAASCEGWDEARLVAVADHAAATVAAMIGEPAPSRDPDGRRR